ncbi:MAG: FemAB family XrtA/PEP-CTERM system-associated protein [Phycisphaerae bacterium]
MSACSVVAPCPMSERVVQGPRVRVTECHLSARGPDARDVWDAYVQSHPHGTLFHTTAWYRAVKQSFPHDGHYLIAHRGDRVVGVLPMFLVKSWLTGRMLVSVPYGVGGGIIADDADATAALFETARHIAADLRCRVIDFRSEHAAVPELGVIDRYVGFRSALPASSSDVLGGLPRKARAAARKARDRHGLRVGFGDRHFERVWSLYCRSMRRLGSISYPRAFVRNLLKETPDRHWVSLVTLHGRPVAGLITFMFKQTVMPYFVGTTDNARTYNAGHYVYLTLMEHAVDAGYRVFDFGRSRRDNLGCCEFKRLHGFAPRPLGYQRYVPPGMRPSELSPSGPRIRRIRRVWTHLPLSVTRLLGACVAKHIPG